MNRTTATGALLMSLAVLSGCGTGSESDSQTSAAETTTRVPRATDNSGRPPIAFDPCLDIPDSVLTQAGYDPASKKMNEYPMDGYTFLGCDFKTPVRQYTLSALSGNVTFAEEKQKNADHAREIDINGRPALLKLEETNREACAVSLETNYGILILLRGINRTDPGALPIEQWCAGLEDTARLIEPLLAEQ